MPKARAPRLTFPGSSAALFTLAVCGALSGCGRGESPPRVALSSREPVESASPGDESALRVVIAPMESPQLSFAHYSALFAHIGRLAGRRLELVQSESYSDAVASLEHRRADLALVCSGPYLDASDEFSAEILAVPEVAGSSMYRALIIVPRDSPYRNFDDLRGRSFALTDPLSTSGMMYPAYLLRQRGERTRTFFGSIVFTKGHDNSIHAVAEGLVDGAAVAGFVFDDFAKVRPKVAARVRVIARSGPVGNPPLIAHPRLDQALKERIRAVLLTLHESEEGRGFLARMRVDRFVRGDPKAYAQARRMRRRVLERGGAP